MLPKSLVWRVQECQGDDDFSRTCGLSFAEFDMGGQSDRRVTVWSILMSNSSSVGFRLALMFVVRLLKIIPIMKCAQRT